MLKIITVPLPSGVELCNGKQITFEAPCSCEGVTGIKIGNTTFNLYDTSGYPVDNRDVFVQGALVSVIIDTVNSNAYIQSGLSSGGTYYAIIQPGISNSSWIEDTTTGIKTQYVKIDRIREKNNVLINHSSENIDTGGYQLFISEEDEYVSYITNGYAKPCDGGINFYIFGEANTIPIPIVVKVI